jgi:thioredoxin
MTSELEQIRARKMAEMMERAQSGERSSKTRSPVELTDSSFESAIRGNRVVVVDCWAAWCYPCRRIAPIMDELASEYGSAALFAKLDVDESPGTAMTYSVQSIPTILIIKDGLEVERIVGAVPKGEIESALRKYL